MTETEAAWVAGLLEGEGCFLLVTQDGYTHANISCAMTDEDVIQKLAVLTGVSEPHPQKIKENHKPVFSWTIADRTATRQILEQIRPFMGKRRGDRIDEILTFLIAAGPRPEASHGSYSTYRNYGCRCDPCTDARRAYGRDYYNRKLRAPGGKMR